MDSNASRRKKIWVEGTAEGIKTLHQQILAEVATACTGAQISHLSLNETRLSNVNGVTYAIAQERDSLSIAPSPANGLLGVGVWNNATDYFFQNFVEPLKDRVGGVTTGVSFQSDNGAPL